LLESAHSTKGIEILPSSRRHSRRRTRTGGWLVLASVLLVAGSAWLFEYRQHAGPAASVLAGNTLTRSNTTNTAMGFTLEEGTQVKLDPGARLSWPNHFPPGKREVVLDGSAFFQVSKDPHHPFFVYCHDLVLHVLGTSFLVTDGKKDNTIEVSVSSGKVEVYEKTTTAPKGDAPRKTANGVLLTPNQELVYTVSNRTFEVTLVDKPLPLDTSITSSFQQARLNEVIQSLQHIYGIEIEVEEDAQYNCRFSGKLNGMDLYTALNAFCRPLGMSWEIKETKILLRGPGCDTP
jgi:ferric-dicitrate binding protein FerR (iron transport regulator)